MYLHDLGKSLRRRWYLTLIATALVAGAVLGALTLVPASYQTTASVVLIPPEGTDEPQSNRYLNLSGLDQAADVVVRALNSDRTHTTVAERVPGSDFTVEADWATSAPIFIVTSEGTTTAESNATLDAVLAEVPSTLARLQQSLAIGPGAQIVSLELTRDDEPALVQKSRLRAAVAVLVVVTLLMLFAIALVDGLALRRRSRLEAAAPVAGTSRSHPAATSPEGGQFAKKHVSVHYTPSGPSPQRSTSGERVGRGREAKQGRRPGLTETQDAASNDATGPIADPATLR